MAASRTLKLRRSAFQPSSWFINTHIFRRTTQNRDTCVTWVRVYENCTEVKCNERRRQHGGGQRGIVHGFSAQSRRRLKTLLSKVRRIADGHLATLTYPDAVSIAPQKWNRDIECFCKRLQRTLDSIGIIYRIEFEERQTGNLQGTLMPHIHLLLLNVSAHELAAIVRALTNDPIYQRKLQAYAEAYRSHFGRSLQCASRPTALATLRLWIAIAWWEVVGSNDSQHRFAATEVNRVRDREKVKNYLSKPDPLAVLYPVPTGRLWGRKGTLDTTPSAEVPLTQDQLIQLRRAQSRWLQSKGQPYYAKRIKQYGADRQGSPRFGYTIFGLGDHSNRRWNRPDQSTAHRLLKAILERDAS